jgi:phytoene desaturase
MTDVAIAPSASGPAARNVARAAGHRPTATVVGAGIGGLATAVRLAHAGWDVTVLEQHHQPGGRAGRWESEGFTFDTGPSLVMMTEYWQKLFSDVGRRLEDYVTLVQIDPCYRIHFPDGSSHDRSSVINRLIEECELLEPGCGPRLLAYLARTSVMYRDGLRFIGRNLHRPTAMMDPASLGILTGGALGDLQKLVGKYFKDERMQQSLSFQTLYLGLSPYESMAIYSLLPYVEIAGGIFYPMGGMFQLALALERLATELGVTFRYGAKVERFETSSGAVRAARLADGSRVAADVVVSNADLPYAYADLLQSPYPGIDRKRFSCSVVLMYIGTNRTWPHLQHHNFVVGRDMKAGCDDLFRRHRMPEDPPFYVVATSRTDPTQAPPGGESLFVLVLAPSQPEDRGAWVDWSVEGPRVEQQTLDRMERTLGMTGIRRHIVTRRLVTPEDFRLQYGNTRGEAFGLSHNFMQIGYFRPHNRHATLKNLYFVGQSTHPGCGLPMVLISAECVTDRIREEVAP